MIQVRVRRERLRSLAVEGNPEDMKTAEAVQALAELAAALALGFMLEGTGLYHSEEPVDSAPGAYEGLAWKELTGKVRSELGTLPERERTIIARHYAEGLTFDQIGAAMGITKGRVSQLHRQALNTLRKRLHSAGQFRIEG